MLRSYQPGRASVRMQNRAVPTRERSSRSGFEHIPKRKVYSLLRFQIRSLGNVFENPDSTWLSVFVPRVDHRVKVILALPFLKPVELTSTANQPVGIWSPSFPSHLVFPSLLGLLLYIVHGSRRVLQNQVVQSTLIERPLELCDPFKLRNTVRQPPRGNKPATNVGSLKFAHIELLIPSSGAYLTLAAYTKSSTLEKALTCRKRA